MDDISGDILNAQDKNWQKALDVDLTAVMVGTRLATQCMSSISGGKPVDCFNTVLSVKTGLPPTFQCAINHVRRCSSQSPYWHFLKLPFRLNHHSGICWGHLSNAHGPSLCHRQKRCYPFHTIPSSTPEEAQHQNLCIVPATSRHSNGEPLSVPSLVGSRHHKPLIKYAALCQASARRCFVPHCAWTLCCLDHYQGCINGYPAWKPHV